VKALLGSILIGVGLLIATVSGACSLMFIAEAFSDAAMAQAVLLLGGIPFLAGIGLIFGGLKLVRIARAENSSLNNDEAPKSF
jgi:uncharacterized membrane protein (DUF441 family)